MQSFPKCIRVVMQFLDEKKTTRCHDFTRIDKNQATFHVDSEFTRIIQCILMDIALNKDIYL
jgi:hypothetical protein